MKSATVALLIADAQADGYPAIYVNPHFTTVTGYAENRVLGQPNLFLQGMKTPEDKLVEVNAALSSGSPFTDTILCYRQNNVPFYNQVILTPVFTDKILTHFVVFFQDVTEQEQTQQFLEDAKQRAEESARLKSGFLASMSHEVRTPLHGVSGALQLVNKTAMTKEQLRYVNLAKDSLRNLQHIVDDILDFSKIEAGQLGMEKIAYDLPLLIQTIYEQNSITCQQKGLSLLLETNFQPHTLVIGDPVRLRQILGNLLSNAVKFTEKGTITMKMTLLRSRNSNWILKGSVEDTGIGIGAENLDSIFEVFRQEDISTTRRFGGTGLGLSISRQLCRLLGGDLSAASEKGKGSQFIFTMTLGHMNAMASTSQEVDQPNPQYRPISTAKVLIVEDNEINQLIAREHLSQHKTMTTRHGKEALEALNRMKLTFDMILMDCHMPEMDGFETTKRIRNGEAGDKYKHVPIIALTANAMKGDREQCYCAGMDDYISKPFTAKELLDTVAKYMH
nr:ATP-binding protein [Alteromonas sp. C1M14]